MDNFTAVLKWVCTHGASVQSAKVAAVPGAGRGLILDAAAAEGQLLLRIPRHLMIAEQRLHAELAPLVTACPALAEDDSLLMAAYLLAAAQHCGVHENERMQEPPAETTWGVYLRSLPSLDELLGLPYLWQDAEIDSAGLALWASDVKESRAQVFGADFVALKKAFNGAHAHAAQHACPFSAGPRLSGAAVSALREPTLHEYAWARACVSSRSFLDGGSMDEDFMFAEAAHMLPTAMIPAADMLNHCCDGVTCTAEWLAPQVAASSQGMAGQDSAASANATAVDYVLRSPCDLPAGTEVAISYGEKGGEDMLESHGFVPRAATSARCGTLNPYQSVYVSLAPATREVRLQASGEGYGELADSAKRASTLQYFTQLEAPVEITGTCSSVLDAIGMFRMALCPPSALEGGAHPDSALHQVASARHEAAVLGYIAAQIAQCCGVGEHEWSVSAARVLQDCGLPNAVRDTGGCEGGSGGAAADKGGDAAAAGSTAAVDIPAAADEIAAQLLKELPSATAVARDLVSELRAQRRAIAEHILGFVLALQQACSLLAGGADVDAALKELKGWLRAASGGEGGGAFSNLALPMWHTGHVQALGEGYLTRLLAAPRV